MSANNDAFVIILGSFAAFSVVFFGGLAAEREVALCLRDASIGLVLGGVAMKCFLAQVAHAARETRKRKLAERRAAEEQPQEEEPAPAE